jgi:molecular chaperone DnaK
MTEASHKLAEAMYAKATAKETEGAADASAEGEQAESTKADDDVVDADFEEVKK